jgi:hypothetical protein
MQEAVNHCATQKHMRVFVQGCAAKKCMGNAKIEG